MRGKYVAASSVNFCVSTPGLRPTVKLRRGIRVATAGRSMVLVIGMMVLVRTVRKDIWH